MRSLPLPSHSLQGVHLVVPFVLYFLRVPTPTLADKQ